MLLYNDYLNLNTHMGFVELFTTVWQIHTYTAVSHLHEE